MANRTPARDRPGALGRRRGSWYRGSRVTPVEGRDLSSRRTQYVVKDLEIGQPINSNECPEAADGVARESVRSCPRAGCGKSARPVRRAGCGNGAMVEPLRHRQTKGAATDMFYLTPPRHISTLHFSDVLRPSSDVRCWGLNRPESAAPEGRLLTRSRHPKRQNSLFRQPTPLRPRASSAAM